MLTSVVLAHLLGSVSLSDGFSEGSDPILTTRQILLALSQFSLDHLNALEFSNDEKRQFLAVRKKVLLGVLSDYPRLAPLVIQRLRADATHMFTDEELEEIRKRSPKDLNLNDYLRVSYCIGLVRSNEAWVLLKSELSPADLRELSSGILKRNVISTIGVSSALSGRDEIARFFQRNSFNIADVVNGDRSASLQLSTDYVKTIQRLQKWPRQRDAFIRKTKWIYDLSRDLGLQRDTGIPTDEQKNASF